MEEAGGVVLSAEVYLLSPKGAAFQVLPTPSRSSYATGQPLWPIVPAKGEHQLPQPAAPSPVRKVTMVPNPFAW